MRIRLEHITGGLLDLLTPHDDPDKPVILIYESEGDLKYLQAQFERSVTGTYGFYGHWFDSDLTTNLDLVAVLHQGIKDFEVVGELPLIKPNVLPFGTIT